jgi:hypothetical protein
MCSATLCADDAAPSAAAGNGVRRARGKSCVMLEELCCARCHSYFGLLAAALQLSVPPTHCPWDCQALSPLWGGTTRGGTACCVSLCTTSGSRLLPETAGAVISSPLGITLRDGATCIACLSVPPILL